MSDILNRDLSQEEEKILRESLETWKEEVYSKLMEEVDKVKEDKIAELEEANELYREQLKEEYADKMVQGLNEMRDSIRSEVISEVVTSNPELQVLEKIKELVAPTLNEDYTANMYAEELVTIKEQLESYKRKDEIMEGAKTLADLITPYSSKTQNIILSLIKEGNSEEVTEQFYSLIESLQELEEAEEEDTEEDADDDMAKVRAAKKKSKKSKKDDKEDDEEDDEEEDDSEEDDEEKDDEEEDDEEVDEDTDFDDGYISEDASAEKVSKKSGSSFLDEIRRLSK